MLRSWIARARSIWRGIARPTALDAEMQDEFRHHIDMRAAELVRAGLPPAEAARTARVEFGGTVELTAQGREARGLRWFDSLRFSWIDVKLGIRMLIKYPGLTLVSGLAMGLAIAIGAGGSTAIALITSPVLPLDEGERIVGIQMWDVAVRNPERRILHDVADWRTMRTLQDVGLYRPTVRNLITADGRADVVRGAEMSAAGFRLARVAPLLGRYFVDDDERQGGSPVIVLGFDLWRSRFAADSSVIGRSVRFGPDLHTVVGVMPPGFAFPLNDNLWVPPRINPDDFGWREGPGLFAFARLAPGATLSQAQAELTTLAAGTAVAHPVTDRTLRPQVLPYAQSWFELDDPDVRQGLRTARFLMALLLVVVCTNVAVLVYARTATRQGEIAVRSALGASRARIVTQLFGEALALSALGAVVGLVIVGAVASRLDSLFAQIGVRAIPFWLRFAVSGTTLAYLVALAVTGAFIIGVIPGLQLTGRRVQTSLQRLAGGHATVHLGRLWTGLVITEVAIAVAFLPAAVRFAAEWIATATTGPGFPAEQYLSAALSLEQTMATPSTSADTRAFLARFDGARAELGRRLDVEPAVLAATFTSDVPGAETPARIEIDSVTRADSARAPAFGWPLPYPRVRLADVDVNYCSTFDTPVLAGRGFRAADSAASLVIVNRAFVDSLLGGRSALGRRVRTVTLQRNVPQPGPWLEIVGVVEDVPAQPAFDRPGPAVYRVAAAARRYPATLVVRTRGDPVRFVGRLRAVAAEVEPGLLVRDVGTLDAVIQATHAPLEWIAIALGAITLAVLILSAAGIYALMSVTVTQRRREIGIRVALGASRRRLLSGIFLRAGLQLGAGVAAGVGVAAALDAGTGGALLGAKSAVLLPAVSVFAIGVGVLAALLPARRALSIQPAAILKAE